MGELLRDSDVRQAVRSRLLSHARRCSETLIVEELGLNHGTNRVDIAVINGHIRGLEIKAEADKLDRLPQQVAAYGCVVDKACLIVAPRHLDAAVDMLPAWWGIIVATRGSEQGVSFKRMRAERANRAPDAMMVARLLWRPEVTAALRELGVTEKALRAPREGLYSLLVAKLSRRQIGALVRETLKRRVSWRDRPQPL